MLKHEAYFQAKFQLLFMFSGGGSGGSFALLGSPYSAQAGGVDICFLTAYKRCDI